ncbi:MAG: DUF1844 domain-containing protein [Thermoanaerobaculia bacterium]|nr:DUF1844 domain-containing protein [Thermoanaerobaculia bacterium]
MTDRTPADKQIKVTDKRMFTPEGELREEFKNLDSRPAESASVHTPDPSGSSPAATSSPAASQSQDLAAETREPEPPAKADYPSGAHFEDLVALLAQTTVTFLQQASRPQARSESLEQAQLYLDLLGVLRDKTQGNLAPAEDAMLQDALAQLRLAFAQRG